MAALDDKDNFAEEFAALLNALSTNIVIPESALKTPDEDVTKADVLKDFAANHAHQEVYGKIGGQLKAAQPPADLNPSEMSPSDISINGVGGISTETLENKVDKGQAITVNNGQVEGIDVAVDIPTKQLTTGGTHSVDVGKYAHKATLQFSSAKGVKGQGNTTNSGSQLANGGEGGDARQFVGSVDLEPYQSLKLHLADGKSGYTDGNDGNPPDYSGDTSPGSGGRGGGSSALIGVKSDGSEELLVETGGGGGGGGAGGVDSGTSLRGGSGGNGGGPGGNGGGVGYGESGAGGPGGSGDVKVHSSNIIQTDEQTVADQETGKATLFK